MAYWSGRQIGKKKILEKYWTNIYKHGHRKSFNLFAHADIKILTKFNWEIPIWVSKTITLHHIMFFVSPAKHSGTGITLSGVCLSVCLSGSHTFLVVVHSYVSQAIHAFIGMLPLHVWELLNTHWNNFNRLLPVTFNGWNSQILQHMIFKFSWKRACQNTGERKLIR